MKGTNRKKMSGRLTFFLFTLIPVILYTFFYVVSVINGVRYSFTDWDGMAQKFNFIGLKNYQTLFKNPYFWNSLKTTVLYSIMLVIGVIVTSLILSISLNSLKAFKTLTKSIYFVPAMIGGVTIALIWDAAVLPGASGDRKGTGNRLAVEQSFDDRKDGASCSRVRAGMAGSCNADRHFYCRSAADSG